MVFGEEPLRVAASFERDPKFKIDRLASGILEYPSGQCVFTVSTQLVPFQKMQFFGTEARIDVEIPFNAPPDKPTRIFIDDGNQLYAGQSATMESFAICDQYTIQGDLFSKAVMENTEVPNPMEDAIRNMAVLDALFRAGESGGWVVPERL
jgi:predicted dehydrogenase